MSLYNIKKVPANEYDKLIAFIDLHWKKGHALVKSKSLMDFQHYNKMTNEYNFIVAENQDTHEYDALVGFIPMSQYDEQLAEEGNYWGAIWKVREDVNNEEINNAAFYIWKCIFKQPYFKSYAAIGISNIAKQIYKVSRIPVDYLRQYYIANEEIIDFFVAVNLIQVNPSDAVMESVVRDININTILSTPSCSYQPKKTIQYLKGRYGNHPLYSYRYWGIFSDSELKSIWVLRMVNVNGHNILRVVDVLGNLETLGSLYSSVQALLKQECCEYVDFMNYGISEAVFKRMGFQKLDLNSDVIVPNYFEPFEQCNVKIEIAMKASFDYVAFKGDSDQDRPNIL